MFVEGKPRTVFFLQTLYLRYLSRRLKKLRMGECHAKCRALVKAINIFGWLNSDQHQGICFILYPGSYLPWMALCFFICLFKLLEFVQK